MSSFGQIVKHPVRHPLLKNYIKFFWELCIENTQLNHSIIPQRNINLRINLNDTPHYASIDGKEHMLENVYFLGLHDHFKNTCLKVTGNVSVLGVCFSPDGFYPFLNIPVSDFKNQMLGAREVGFKVAERIIERLKEASDIETRLTILEDELLILYVNTNKAPETFRRIFAQLKENECPMMLADFCKQNNIGIRKLERMYNKFVGLPPNSYTTLNRFHRSANQLLHTDYSKLSDLAYDNGYYDQMHFIREFKRFAGNTPKSFVNQNNTILHIGKLT